MLSKVHSFLEALFVYLVILDSSGGFRLLRFFCGVFFTLRGSLGVQIQFLISINRGPKD